VIPHTAAKHALLSRYLMAWFPIMSRYTESTGITYAEGFSGPGEYRNSTESSPVIAMTQACRREVVANGSQIRMLFLEERPDRFEHLGRIFQERFSGTSLPGIVKPHLVNGPCETQLIPNLDRIGAWAGPVFVNLDGWGADTPFDVVARIAEHKSSEVLVTFKDGFFTRFAKSQDQKAGDRVFGDSIWRQVAELPTSEKQLFLLSTYRGKLTTAGLPYTLTFELVDEGGHTLFLIFGTSSLDGVRKMKDALWSVDAVSGERFRDPKDPQQLAFSVHEPNFAPLRKTLVEVLRQRGSDNLESIRDHVLKETVYREAHVKPQIDGLIGDTIVKQVENGRSYAEKVYTLTNDGQPEPQPLTLFS